MGVVRIFLLGVGILIGAILLNVISSTFGLIDWNAFIRDPSEATIVSYVWLFFVYPLCLGILAHCLNTALRAHLP